MELQIGDTRHFSFSDKLFKIREILENPAVSMWWTWDTGICPHCKKKIERHIKHNFYRIEILGDNDKSDENLTDDDIAMLGFTTDRRLMHLDIEARKDVYKISKKFSKFKENK